MIESLSDPGSDRNPLRLDGAISVPRVLNTEGPVVHAVLDSHDGDEVLAVAAVVKRDGKIGTYELLGSGPHVAYRAARPGGEESVADLLAAVRDARFAPAQCAGRADGGGEHGVVVRQDHRAGVVDAGRSGCAAVAAAGRHAACARFTSP